MHFRDASNDARPIPCGDLDGAWLRARLSQTLRRQGSGVCREALRNSLLLRTVEVLECVAHLHLTKGVDLLHRFAPFLGQGQQLDAAIVTRRLLLQLFGRHQLGQQSADTGFVQPKPLHQLRGRHVIVSVNLQQRVHR